MTAVTDVTEVTDIWGDAGTASDGEQLLDDLREYLTRFVAFPSPEAADAIAAWIVHCHALDAFDTTPRLALLSPEPGSGKTRVLEVIEPIVPNGMPTFNASAAVLFRSMTMEDEHGDTRRPTVLLDEADTIFGPRASKDHEDLRGFINAGYRRGANAQRVAMVGKRAEIETFPAFAAVAIAGLDDLPDTVMTRSIVIRMRRRSSDEVVSPYRRRTYATEAAALHERCNRWGGSHYEALSHVIDDLPEGIEDRAADIWEPLILIGDTAGPSWSKRIRAAAQSIVGQSRSTGETLGIRLLADLRAVFGSDEHLASTTILERLNGLDDAPWGDLRGRPLDARGLSQRLRKYGVTSKSVRVDGVTVKGYDRGDLADPWKRYLPDVASVPAPPEKSVTSVTSVTAQASCLGCGEAMTEDLFGDGRHATCPVTEVVA